MLFDSLPLTTGLARRRSGSSSSAFTNSDRVSIVSAGFRFLGDDEDVDSLALVMEVGGGTLLTVAVDAECDVSTVLLSASVFLPRLR